MNTNTYPVTRNIRVELAITIIVTVFGVIAQMRLWKVIKERRANEASSREEEEKKKEEAEAEVGRQLEEKNQQERAEWERMYSNGSGKEPSMTETAVADDSRRGSDGFNSNNETANSMEMKDMTIPDAQGGASDSGNTLDAVKEGTEEEEAPSCGQSHHTPEDQDEREPDSHSNADVSRPATPPPEKAFHVNANVRDDASENGAIMGSEAGTPRSKRLSGISFRNRMSWRSGNGTKLNHQSESEEALVAHDDATSSVAGVVDDIRTLSSRRSSIASDIHKDTDDVTQHSESTVKPLPQKNILQEAEENNLNPRSEKATKSIVAVVSSESHPEDANVIVLPQTHNVPKAAEKSISEGKTTQTPKEDEVSTKQHELAAKTEPSNIPEVMEKAETAGKIKEVQKGRTDVEKLETPAEEPQSQKQAKKGPLERQSKYTPAPAERLEETSKPREPETETKSEPEAKPKPQPQPQPQPIPVKKPVKPKLDTSTVKRIPEQTSKVIHTFRTNEWAKHLADAETPDLEPLEFEPEPEIEPTKSDEAAAPVNVDELLQTPLNAQPPPAVNSPAESSTSPDEARRRSRLSMAPVIDVPRSKTRNSTHMMSGAKPPLVSRNLSSSSLVAQQLPVDDSLGPLRSPSAPLLTLNTPNTGHDNDKEQTESPRWSGPPPLLAVREDMVRNRMSSTSLRHDPWGPRNASRQSLVDPGRVMSPPLSIPDEGDEEPTGMTTPIHDDDDVPLSKRRAMLQRQTMESPSSTSLQGFDRGRSPAVTSTNSGKPAAAMAAWRQSMREDISSRRDPLSLNSSPTSPERPQSLWGSVQQMKDASNTRVGDAIAEGMQKGSMTDLHRQAMRRMQASANRKL